MVADGMSPGVPALAEAFSHIVRGRGTAWHALASREDVVTGFFDMASLDSLVTDSAAAASAWASGSRIRNWAVNMLPDGRELTPIAPLARARGKRIGLVTTTRITHATPAAFAAVVPSRDLEDDIAPQYLDRVDVLLGGGSRHFDVALRRDKRDLLADFRAAGWAAVRDRDGLLALPADTRVLGLFDADHLPFTIDRAREPALQQRVPTLAEMTRSALARLAQGDDGFLLLVEGGRVDHAAHDNDAASMLHDQLAFDDAIDSALEFIADTGRDDTLLLITTDHGTGNPGLSGMGGKYHQSNSGFERLAASTISFVTLHARLTAISQAGAAIAANDVADVVRDGTGIDLAFEDARLLAEVFAGRRETGPIEVSRFQSNLAALLGQALANHTGMTFTGVAHTSDWALSMALGPGARRFAGLRANIDVYSTLADFFGIEHRNPRMTPEEARRLARTGISFRHA